jgi:hypothetical protein
MIKEGNQAKLENLLVKDMNSEEPVYPFGIIFG